MPVYEFACTDCGRKYEIVATLAEFDAGLKPACPKCGGKRCKQVIGRVTLLTSSKSEESFDDDFGDETDMDSGGLDDDYGSEDLGENGDFGDIEDE